MNAIVKHDTPEEGVPSQAPAVRTDDDSGSFISQLDRRRSEYVTLLGSPKMADRFIAVAKAAVKKNPALLDCTPRSLFVALSQAAQDCLLPDGREGVITSYKTQVTPPPPAKPYFENVASWSPMVYGIRKRARELDDIIIDAQVVCENDHFTREQGDDPKIVHTPTPLDKEPGALIGCYAIFKKDGDILHREVMRKSEVLAVKNQSKAQKSLMWTTFETEGWRKSVIRRGAKTVPVSESLERLITREDEHFDFSQDRREALAPPSPPSPPSVPQITETAAEQPSEPPPPPPPPPPAAKPPAVAAEVVEDKPTGPAAIPVPEKNGKPTWVPWGKNFIDIIMACNSHEEIDAWRAANTENLASCEQAAPKAYASIQKATAKRSNELMEGQKKPEPPAPSAEAAKPSDDYADWQKDVMAELAACTTEAAVEDLRDRALPDMFPPDRQAFKDACAERMAEIFRGK